MLGRIYVHLFGCLFICLLFVVYVRAQSPFISIQPKNTIAVAGSDVILKCTVENLPLGSLVQWTKGTFGLGYDRVLSGFPRHSIIGDESIGEYNLLIQKVEVGDEDVYECQVTSHGLRTNPVTLTIEVPAQNPFVDGLNKNVKNVRENAENKLTCHALSGKPAAKIQWFLDGIEITRNLTNEVVGDASGLQNTSSTLTIWPTRIDDGNQYKCFATTIITAPNQPTSIKKNTTVAIRVLKPPKASIIIEPSSNILEGTRMSALCDVSSTSSVTDMPTSYSWFINGRRIEDETSSRIQLNIVSKEMDGDRIGCQAINSVGMSPISSIVINVLYTPILVSKPTKVTTDVGRDAFFKCEWKSNPTPEITWKRYGVVIGSGEILLIKSVSQSDAGEITCEGKAGHIGRDEVKTELVVRGPPLLITNDEEATTVGSEVKVIQCKISSFPGLTGAVWSWQKSNKEYSLSGNMAMYADGEIAKTGHSNLKYKTHFVSGKYVATLFIYNIDDNDFTNYKCDLANDYGNIQGYVMLKEYEKNAEFPILLITGIAAGAIFLLVLVVVVYCCCCKSKKNGKKKTSEINKTPSPPTRPLSASESLLHHLKNDPDSDNQSTNPSSTPDELMLMMRPYGVKSPLLNDDGYYTEAEASQFTRGNSSLSASSVNTSIKNEQLSPLLAQGSCPPPMAPYIVRTSPSAVFDKRCLPVTHRNYLSNPNIDSDIASSVSDKTSSSISPYSLPQGRATTPKRPPKPAHLIQAPSPSFTAEDRHTPIAGSVSSNQNVTPDLFTTRMATNV